MFKKFNLKPADRIVVPKSGLRVIQHHAIYLGQNKKGEHLIAENKIGYGVRVVNADIFFKDAIEITRIERFSGNNFQRKIAIKKALTKLGLPYDLINYNCHHFANEIQNGWPQSEQVINAFAVGIMILFLTLLNQKLQRNG
jgi:uncharacterized protein YycO